MTKKMPGVLLDILGKESLHCLPQSSVKDTTEEEEEEELDGVSVPPPTETATRFPVETDADNIASSDIHKTAPEPLSFSSTLTTLHLTVPRESPPDAEGFLDSLLLLSLLLTPFVGVCRFPELRREPAMRARTRGRRR